MKRIIFKTNSQKIIEYLIKKPGYKFLSKEIQVATRISKAGANFALLDLVKTGLIKREKKGNIYLYTIDDEHPVIKQLKVLQNVINLTPLITKMKHKTNKIILFGSTSRGENTEESDIDLFVVTNQVEEVERLIEKKSYKGKIQLITRTPLQYIEMEKTDPHFYQQVERGIILWEGKNEP